MTARIRMRALIFKDMEINPNTIQSLRGTGGLEQCALSTDLFSVVCQSKDFKVSPQGPVPPLRDNLSFRR